MRVDLGLLGLLGRLGGVVDAAANLTDLAGEPVELVLDVFEALREGAQPPFQPFDVARRGQIEGRHRRLLGLHRLLAGAEGRGEGVLEHVAVEERLRELGDRLLAASPQALLVVVLLGH